MSSEYYEYTDEGTVNGVRFVTVLDDHDNPVAYHMPFDDAYAEYGDVSGESSS